VSGSVVVFLNPHAPSAGEDELARREQAMAARGKKIKNWPSCRPIARNHIAEDIPKQHAFVVRLAYLGWLLMCVAVFFNCLTEFVLVFSSKPENSDIGTTTSLLIGIIYLIIVPVAAWMLWYKGLYAAVMYDRPRSYCCFFLFCFFQVSVVLFIMTKTRSSIHHPSTNPQVCFTGVAFLGITGTYLAGLLTLIDIGTWGRGYNTLKGFAGISTAMWSLPLIVSASVMYIANKVYRSAGLAGYREMKTDVRDGAREAAWDVARG